MPTDTKNLMDGPRSTFQVGNALSTGFSTWLKNVVPYGLMNLVIHIPLLVYLVIATSGTITADSLRMMTVVMTFGGMALGLIATGAMTYGVVMQLRGTPASMGACMSVGLSRLLPVLAVGITVFLLVLLGFILLFVPGIIFICMYWVAVPVAVVEKAGPSEAMARSKLLTAGNKLQIFILLLVVGVIDWVVGQVVQAALLRAGDPSSIRTYLLVLNLIVVFFTGSFGAVINAVGYHQLRASKEGVSVEDIAKVFD